MQERVEKRLKELKSEFDAGQKMLADLDTKQANLRGTLLRISGAIQVLEEILAKADGSASEEFGTPAYEYHEQAGPGQEMAA